MEKRGFELLPRKSARLVVAITVVCAAFAGFITWLCINGHSYWPLMLIAWVVLGCWWRIVFPQIGKLEISDEGLFLTVRRGVGYLLRWDAIQSVRVHEHSDAARLWSAIIEDSQGHVVRVPRKCTQTAEILSILRQRLPENVFQAW